MNIRFVSCLAIALICAAWVRADLELERRREAEQKVPGWAVRSYVDTFKADKRALAVVSGSGATCLGLYVFDEFGNCVASDDVAAPKTSDDLAAEWVPAQTARYQVEVRNAGFVTNGFDFALR